MNIFTKSSIAQAIKVTFAALVLMGVTTSAFAATSASHVIRNTVTVDYQDPGGATFSDDDFVDVTTQLVASAPSVTFDATASDSLNPVSPGESVDLVYTVISTANGSDLYDITPLITQTAGAGATTGSASADTATLGGSNSAAIVLAAAFETTDVAGGAGTAISVPADDDGTDDNENGFAVGDTIVLDVTGGTIVCIVNVVNDSGSLDPAVQANATSSIEVDRCGDGDVDSGGVTFNLAVGDQMGERIQFTLPVAVTGGSATGDLNVESTFASNTDPAQTTVINTTINVVVADLQIYKFVRNISGGTTGNDNANCTAGTPFECLDVGGTIYFDEGVTAAPGEQLEYMVLLYNNAGTVQNVLVTDPVVVFTTYEATSIQVISDTVADDTTGAGGSGTCLLNVSATNTCFVDGTLSGDNLSDAVDGGDFGGNSGGILTIAGGYEPGGGPGNVASETVGGTLAPATVSVVRYLINVD